MITELPVYTKVRHKVTRLTGFVVCQCPNDRSLVIVVYGKTPHGYNLKRTIVLIADLVKVGRE